MPIYTFFCKKCKNKFECFLSIEDSKHFCKCVKCESNEIEKLVSNFSIKNRNENIGKVVKQTIEETRKEIEEEIKFEKIFES